jgi:thiamine-phosphate pyrophosphorylase
LAADVFDERFEFYAITDQKNSLGRNDLEIAAALIAGGVSCLQYRAKKVSARQQWETARQLRAMCREAGLPFIVNDRADLALACGADGLHIGQDDMPLQEARRLMGPGILIGRSTHSPSQAREAWDQGADYIGYGPLFATQTKENNVPPLGLGTLKEIASTIPIPVVAIGGIKLQHLEAISAEGAQHIAVVTALTLAEDVAAAAGEFRRAWRRIGSKGQPHL